MGAAPTKKEARRAAVRDLLPTLRDVAAHTPTTPTYIDRQELEQLLCKFDHVI